MPGYSKSVDEIIPVEKDDPWTWKFRYALQWNTESPIIALFEWPTRDHIVKVEKENSGRESEYCITDNGGLVLSNDRTWIPYNASAMILHLITIAHAAEAWHRIL